MIILDTTVLSYAVGEAHPLREPCRRLLEAHGSGRIEATTTVEVIQEFVHVRSRRRTRTDAVALARHYVAAFRLLVSDEDDLARGLTLFARHPALGAFDAVLAAVALNRKADWLVSADQAFGEASELRWIDPATPPLDRLIGNAPRRG
ncbi:MAG TPA: type II toxin-antitoxin system VapC family toxin [Chloroflexota bacterium]|nr:type II toxin-antitoxin system VapC family toxin [Chloroflexota bacterium]